MASLTACIRKYKVNASDASEIRDEVRASDTPAVGMQNYIDKLGDDLEDLRSQLGRQGFSVAAQEIAVDSGAIPPSMIKQVKVSPTAPRSDVPIRYTKTSGIKYSKDRTSKEFKTWSKGYPVIEGKDIAATIPGQGAVFVVNHGTTHDIKEFDPKVRGTKEGYLGRVSYFTSSAEDAEAHYKGRGPDLERRIDDLSERFSDMPVEDFETWMYDNGFDPDMADSAKDNIQALEQIAGEYLQGPVEKNMELFVRSDNPVVVGGSKETWIDPYPGREDIEEEIRQEYMAEENITIEELDEFEDEIRERVDERMFADGNAIHEALADAIADSIDYMDTQRAAGEALEGIDLFNEISATSLDEQLRASDYLVDLMGDDGEYIGYHVIGQMFKNLGYDAYILANADKTFTGMRMPAKTSHVHVLGETPSKIKSRVSEFTEDPRIKFSREKGAEWYSQMERVLDKKLGTATPSMVKTQINSWAKKGEFKQSELDWSGLTAWVDNQEGKIKKQQVMDYLAENRVEIQEVVKGVDAFEYESLDASGGVYESGIIDTTKHSQWQLPGGENYRELLLTLPTKNKTKGVVAKEMFNKAWNELSGKEKQAVIQHMADTEVKGENQYKSPHYDEPSILAHIRMSERTVDGKRVLHIEEIQSDWAAEGREKGFGAQIDIREDQNGYFRAYDNNGQEMELRVDGEVYSALASEQAVKDALPQSFGERGVPDTPFKSTGAYTMLAFKKMVRYAAENDFDTIAWTAGKEQAARYDLIKQISRIKYRKVDGKYEIKAERGQENILRRTATAGELEGIIGKEVTQKIVGGVGDRIDDGGIFTNKLEGLDIEVGGEGMKGFYDKILPAEVNKFFNKKTWGKAKVGEIEITMPVEPGLPPTHQPYPKTLHSLPVTPQMKSKALREGMPLFSREYATDKATADTDQAQGQGQDSEIKYSKVMKEPEKTVKAYKLFRTLKKQPGKIFPLFIGKSIATPMNEWIKAEYIPTKGFAHRPGWHSGTKPLAPHLMKKDGTMPSTRVWAEIELPADVDWQTQADTSKTKDIRDKVPEGGFYRFKRPGLQGGEWRISGAIKVVKLLSAEEVSAINTAEDIKYSKPMGVSPATDKFFGPQKSTLDTVIENVTTDPVKKFNAWAKTNLADRLDAIKVLGKEAYMLHRMPGNIASQMAAFLRDGKFAWDGNGLQVVKGEAFLPWFKSLKKDGPKFLQWVAAKRAEALEKDIDPETGKGRENFLTKDKRDDIFETTWPSDSAYAKKLNDKFKEFNNNILDIAEQAGVINKEARAEWDQEFYIPFYRLLEDATDTDEIMGSPSKIRRHIQSGIKRLTGSDATIGDPMENILTNWTHLINESMRNQARAHAFEAGKKMGMMRRVPQKWLKMSDRTTLSFLREGKPIYFQTEDAELFNALSEFNHEHLDGMLTQLLGKAKSVLTWGVTIGPAFRVANAIRDTVATGINSPHFIPFISSFQGMIQIITKSADFIAFTGSGGAFTQGYVRGHDPKAQAKYINKLSKEKVITFRTIYDAWQYIGDVSEMMARVQLYSNLKKVGKTHLEASYEAKDIMDFTMKGANKTLSQFTNMVPFMNARIQGLYRMGRGFGENPVSFLTKGALLTMTTMAMWALWKDDERYIKLPDDEKWLYHNLWLGDQHIRIPKAFEVGMLFSSVFEVAANIQNGTEEGKHMWTFLGHAFGDTLAMNPVPQLVKPMAEVFFNKNFFTGNAIEGMGDENRSPGLRSGPWTSVALRDLGEKLNISPKKAQHAIRGYLGSVGTGLIMAADLAYTHVAELPDRPDMSANQYPMLGRFLRDPVAQRTKYGTRAWDMFREVSMVNSDLNYMKKNMRFGEMSKILKSKRYSLMAYEVGKSYKRQLDSLRASAHNITISKTLSGAEKKQRLSRIRNRRNNVQQKMYEAMHKVLKKGN